jgi:TonB family protein
MEAFVLYLLKSAAWLSGFALVFLLFLRNERFFNLNRWFLISGAVVSLLFPFMTVHYTIFLPAPRTLQDGSAFLSGVQATGNGNITLAGTLLTIYTLGALFVLFLIIKQSRSVLKSIAKAEVISSQPVKLIRTAEYTSSFSFFSYVFINPSVTDVETEEIVNHELVHIRQMHWVDLVLVELLCILQWFNPLIWIYFRLVRQNHEYLADEVALQRTSDPETYKATLLNQIVGYPVVSLANSFNYSLNKKRFKMMKNIISSPYRKLKLLLIIPVFALVLYAFAKPEYKYSVSGTNSGNTDKVLSSQSKDLKGTVMQQNGKPLHGAALVLQGTTIGTTSDAKGDFKLTNVPEGAPLVVTYVGYKSKVLNPQYTSDMIIQMVRDTVKLGSVSTPAPPPPPPPPSEIKTPDGKSPLIIIDGKEVDVDLKSIDPNTIENVSVLKDESATSVYGDKGKDGVIVIKTRKTPSLGKNEKVQKVEVTGSGNAKKVVKDQYIVIEEMPQFPGGKEALSKWLSDNVKYPAEAVKNKITGNVQVSFIVGKDGKISNTKVTESVNPYLDAEAVRVVSSMPDWKPGSQAGKPVDVFMKIPINFALK